MTYTFLILGHKELKLGDRLPPSVNQRVRKRTKFKHKISTIEITHTLDH